MPNIASGPNSKTPHYRFYATDQHNLPTANRSHQETRCREIDEQSYSTFLRSSQANSILSREPRSTNRQPNLNDAGQPLTFGVAMRSSEQDYWKAADIDEYQRIFNTSTARPIHSYTIPPDQRRNVTYYNKRVKEKLKVVDSETHTEYRVRGTFGGDRLTYSGPTSSNTAEYPTVKILLNSVLSDAKHKDANTRFATMDLVDFYLGTPLAEKGYVKIGRSNIPDCIIEEYELEEYFDSTKSIYLEISKCMYGHPAAGRLSNEMLKSLLLDKGYHEDPLVSCLFKHETRPIAFALVVDDLGIKYTSDDDLEHLAASMSPGWAVKIDRSGSKFLGMNLTWNYDPKFPTLEIDAPSVVPKNLQRFRPNMKLKGRDTPSHYVPPSYGKPDPHAALPPPPAPRPDAKAEIQQIVGAFLHYARVIDYSMLEQCVTIAETQSAPNEHTVDEVEYLLQYAARNPNNKIVYHGSDMILRCQYDASFQRLLGARSKGGSIFYFVDDDAPIEQMNGLIDVDCHVLPKVCAAVSEAEYAQAFFTAQKAYHFRIVAEALGHKQPPTELFGDNAIAEGILTDSVKIKRSKAIDKSYHWTRDRVRLGDFIPKHIPGEQNAADYFTKPLPRARHFELFPMIMTRGQANFCNPHITES